MIDAERDMALREASIKELVSELRKRDDVDAYDVPENGMSRILTWDNKTELVDEEHKGAAIILRITD